MFSVNGILVNMYDEAEYHTLTCNHALTLDKLWYSNMLFETSIQIPSRFKKKFRNASKSISGNGGLTSMRCSGQNLQAYISTSETSLSAIFGMPFVSSGLAVR